MRTLTLKEKILEAIDKEFEKLNCVDSAKLQSNLDHIKGMMNVLQIVIDNS